MFVKPPPLPQIKSFFMSWCHFLCKWIIIFPFTSSILVQAMDFIFIGHFFFLPVSSSHFLSHFSPPPPPFMGRLSGTISVGLIYPLCVYKITVIRTQSVLSVNISPLSRWHESCLFIIDNSWWNKGFLKGSFLFLSVCLVMNLALFPGLVLIPSCHLSLPYIFKRGNLPLKSLLLIFVWMVFIIVERIWKENSLKCKTWII